MKEVEYHFWQTPPPPGRRAWVKTRYRMTAEQALERLGPAAIPVPGSREVREVPETAAEAALFKTNWSAGERQALDEVAKTAQATLKRLPGPRHE